MCQKTPKSEAPLRRICDEFSYSYLSRYFHSLSLVGRTTAVDDKKKNNWVKLGCLD